MSNTQDFLASGLSLAPNDKAHVSTLLRQVDEAVDQLESGQGDPWLTTLRDAAEQREDLSAAARACHCLTLYYGALLLGGNRKIADYDRALYYAQTLKDCGPESQGLYHAAYGMALFIQTIAKKPEYFVDDIAPAADHLYASIRAGVSAGAQFVVGNCELFKRCPKNDALVHNWGLVYAAYQFLAHDPSLTPLQREENAGKATALLQETRAAFERYSYSELLVNMARAYYPQQSRIALESRPTPEDEAVIKQLCWVGRKEHIEQFSWRIAFGAFGGGVVLVLLLKNWVGLGIASALCIAGVTLYRSQTPLGADRIRTLVNGGIKAAIALIAFPLAFHVLVGPYTTEGDVSDKVLIIIALYAAQVIGTRFLLR